MKKAEHAPEKPKHKDKDKAKDKDKDIPKRREVDEEVEMNQERAVAVRPANKGPHKEQKVEAKQNEDDDFWKGLEEDDHKGDKKPAKMDQS